MTFSASCVGSDSAPASLIAFSSFHWMLPHRRIALRLPATPELQGYSDSGTAPSWSSNSGETESYSRAPKSSTSSDSVSASGSRSEPSASSETHSAHSRPAPGSDSSSPPPSPVGCYCSGYSRYSCCSACLSDSCYSISYLSDFQRGGALSDSGCSRGS